MKLCVVSIYDRAARAYLRPFFGPTEAACVRGFEESVNEPSGPMYHHRHDYALFKVGEFDDREGVFTPIDAECLRKAHEIPMPDPEVEIAKMREALRQEMLALGLVNSGAQAPVPSEGSE